MDEKQRCEKERDSYLSSMNLSRHGFVNRILDCEVKSLEDGDKLIRELEIYLHQMEVENAGAHEMQGYIEEDEENKKIFSELIDAVN